MSESVENPLRFLFYVTLSYSYAVLRPIEKVIKSKGYKVAWFIPQGAEAEKFLTDSDQRLMTVKQVKQFDSHAVLAPGNYIPDFFPGIKVQVFHGFDSGKKNKFQVRGFFDLYCTQGPNITEAFTRINDGTYDVVETGWSKLDPLFHPHPQTQNFTSDKPVVFYAPTFSPKLTSTYALLPEIKALIAQKDWQWIIKLHPKATKEESEMFAALAGDKVKFIETGDIIPLLQAADVILSDTSSVLAEFALQQKPVVALNNRRPEDWMINFTEPTELSVHLSNALNKEESLMARVSQLCAAIHPRKDGKASDRVVKAIEEAVAKGTGHLKAKPLNLLRRLKMRKKLKYYRWR